MGNQGLALVLDTVVHFLNEDWKRKSFFSDLNKSISKRHQLIEQELKNKYPDSVVTSRPGSPTLFVKIIDTLRPNKSASAIILQDTNTTTVGGGGFGVGQEFTRINLTGSSINTAEFLNRLANSKNLYKPSDVFASSENCCPHHIVCCEEQYTVQPGDFKISANSNKGDITIILPFC